MNINFKCSGCTNVCVSKNDFDNHVETCLKYKDMKITTLTNKIIDKNKLFRSIIQTIHSSSSFSDIIYSPGHSSSETPKPISFTTMIGRSSSETPKPISFTTMIGRSSSETPKYQKPKTSSFTGHRSIETPKPLPQTLAWGVQTMSPLDLSSSRIKSIIKTEFDIKYFNDGQEGVARFVVDKLLTDSNGNIQYKCITSIDHIYSYKNMDNVFIKDTKASDLVNCIHKYITKKADKITTKLLKTEPGKKRFLEILDIKASISSLNISYISRIEFCNKLTSLIV